MVRGSLMMRVVGAAAAVALAGCTGCQNEPQCDPIFVQVESPADGTSAQAPLDVVVKVTDVAGNLTELDSVILQTRPATSGPNDWSAAANGVVEPGKATFTAVPLPEGLQYLRVSAQRANSSCAPTAVVSSVQVTGTGALPEVVSIRFQGDANDDKVLNSSELSSTATSVNAIVTMARAGAGCTLKVWDPFAHAAAPPAPQAVTLPTETFAIPLVGTAAVQPYSLQAEISCDGGARKNDLLTNTAAKVLLRIDREAPTCTLMAPTRSLYGPSDDDDTALTGYQVYALGQAGGDASQMRLRLTGGAAEQTTGLQSAAGGSLSNKFTIPSTGDTDYSVILEVYDAAGNVCTVARAIAADFVAPVVTVTAPSGNQTSYNLTVNATVVERHSATAAVTVAPLAADGGTGTSQTACPSGPVSGGAFSCSGSFLAGAQQMTVRVTDAAGNVGAGTQNVTVNAPGCQFAFTTPSANPATLTPANDLQPTVADLQYQFVASSPTTGCGGKTVKLFRNGVELTSLAGVTDSGGVYRSGTVTEPDSGGAQVVYRAEIDDGAGNRTSATVGVIVALSIPIIVVPANNTNLHAQRDLDPTTAGVQAQLLYSPTAPTGFTGTVCSSVQFSAGAACPDGAGGFVLATNVAANTAAFTFPDGSYDLRAIFVHSSGTVAPLSDPTAKVRVNVESVRPVVTSFTYQGNTNGDAHLNAAEQASGDPVAVLAVTGANGGTVVVRRTDTMAIVSGATPVAIASGSATVTLSGLGAAAPNFEAPAFDLVAEVTSALGSLNVTASPPPSGTTLNTAAFSSIRIDRVAPACTLEEPSKAQVGIADDADGASGYQVHVHGVTTSDVGTNGVTLELVPAGGTAQTLQVTPSGGIAMNYFTPVAQSGEVDYVAACTARDLSGNVGARATRNVRVDLAPPTCTIVTPNAASSPYTSSYLIATRVDVTGGGGLKCRMYSTPTAGAEQYLGEADVSTTTGQMNSTFVYLAGAQTVRAEVTDPAGNACSGTGSTVQITVTAPGCSIQFDKPVAHPDYLNISDDLNRSTPATLEYTLTGATNCPNQPVSIYVGTTLVGTPTTNGSGAFSQSVTGISEGAVTFRADMNVGAATSNSWPVTVDLTPPVIVSTVPATNPTGSTLHFVAPGNRNLLAPADPAYVRDTDTGTAGAQANLGIRVTGAAGGHVEILVGTTTVGGPTPVTTGDETPSVPVDLAHNTAPTLVYRATDVAGNTAERNVAAQVDVIAPDAPANVACSLVAGKEREAKVSLGWDPAHDDNGDTGSGPVQYDVRWTNTTVAPTGLASGDEFFDSSLTWQDAAAVAWSSSRIAREVQVPTFNAYYCFVRAYDEQGNYSALGATNPADKVDNFWSKATFANPHPAPASTQLFGRVMAAGGSLNNDATDDLVVGYQQSGSGNDPERVAIYYGLTSGFALQTPQVISAPDAIVGAFGFDVSVGNVGDATPGDNKADLLVGAPRANASAGRAYLFFGTTTSSSLDASSANAIVFAGAAGTALGRSAQITSDMNGDGLREILLTAAGADGGRGRVYLFFGRSRAAWVALASGAPIPMTAADREFLGPTPSVSGTHNFGRLRGGFTSIGTDFTIPASISDTNRLYVFSAGAVLDAGVGPANAILTGIEPGTPNQSLQTLSPGPSTPTYLEAFSTRAQAVDGLFAGVGVDLLVTDPSKKLVYLFANRGASGLFENTATTIVRGPGTTATAFGLDAYAADYSGAGGTDLFVGEGGSVSSLWFLQNRAIGGSEFDATPGASGFHHSRVTGSRLGAGLAAGDFDGDGHIDIAAADYGDGSGKVFVWH